MAWWWLLSSVIGTMLGSRVLAGGGAAEWGWVGVPAPAEVQTRPGRCQWIQERVDCAWRPGQEKAPAPEGEGVRGGVKGLRAQFQSEAGQLPPKVVCV